MGRESEWPRKRGDGTDSMSEPAHEWSELCPYANCACQVCNAVRAGIRPPRGDAVSKGVCCHDHTDNPSWCVVVERVRAALTLDDEAAGRLMNDATCPNELHSLTPESRDECWAEIVAEPDMRAIYVQQGQAFLAALRTRAGL